MCKMFIFCLSYSVATHLFLGAARFSEKVPLDGSIKACANRVSGQICEKPACLGSSPPRWCSKEFTVCTECIDGNMYCKRKIGTPC